VNKDEILIGGRNIRDIDPENAGCKIPDRDHTRRQPGDQAEKPE